MPKAKVLQALYLDHRNIEQTLQVVDEQIAGYQQQGKADFQLIHDVLTYLIRAPDKYHHPFEEKMFALMANRDDSLSRQISATTAEHKNIKAIGKAVIKAIEKSESPLSSSQASGVIEYSGSYVSQLRTHMKQEEELLFRRASKVLTVDDWAKLAKLPQIGIEDPLFSEDHDQSFDALKAHFKQQIEAVVEKYAEHNQLSRKKIKDNLATLSSGAKDINRVVSENSRQAITETFNQYKNLLTARPTKIRSWIVTPVRCGMLGFSSYFKTVSEVSEIIQRTYGGIAHHNPVNTFVINEQKPAFRHGQQSKNTNHKKS